MRCAPAAGRPHLLQPRRLAPRLRLVRAAAARRRRRPGWAGRLHVPPGHEQGPDRLQRLPSPTRLISPPTAILQPHRSAPTRRSAIRARRVWGRLCGSPRNPRPSLPKPPPLPRAVS